MAKFSIYSSDGSTIRYSGTPTYNGTYMKPAYLEFREIAVSAPIDWQVGDYVDYTRTGLRYKLYFIPQPTKNARSGQNGKAFVYQNVQFYAETKKLEIALFRDLVPVDNQIHFSTQQAISVYDNVAGIAERLQACMDEYDPDNWNFVVTTYEGTDFGGNPLDFNNDYLISAYEKTISEDREFSMSNGTILDALQQIYDVWEDVGWTYSVVNSVNTITIGKTLQVTEDQKTNIFQYGRGLGLKTIKKSQANKDEMATRLYVYGSNTNIYPNYYRGKAILDADSVDIQNLMLPINKWGTTYDEEKGRYLPDAKKAYIEDSSAKTKYGLIPRSIYFDGGDNEEIYPSVKKTTIGEIREAKEELEETTYVPSTTIYPTDSERVDVIKSAVNPTDDGSQAASGNKYTDVMTYTCVSTMYSISFPVGTMDKSKEVDTNFIAGVTSGDYDSVLTIPAGAIKATVEIVGGLNITVYLILHVAGEKVYSKQVLSEYEVGTYSISSEEIKISNVSNESSVYFSMLMTGRSSTPDIVRGATLIVLQGTATFNFYHNLPPSFSLTLKQIGFSIGDRADLGDGKTIHMLDGKCAGRSFRIKRVLYQSATDDWFLQMYRGYDEDLSMYFPNSIYEISAGDHFVLLDIAMPELYIYMASNRLYNKGMEMLAKVARIEPYYEPEIDGKVMIENLTAHPSDESYILREGKYFLLKDDEVTDGKNELVLIDTLTISENESAIPTYKVTLRETKKVSFQQSTANTIKTLEQKVVDSSGTLKSVNTASTDYNDLDNKPRIDDVELIGNVSSEDLGLVTKSGTYTDGYVLIANGTNGAARVVSPSTISTGIADKIKDQTSGNAYQIAIVSAMPSVPASNVIYIII